MFNKVTIDQVRRFWDQRPCNVRHAQASLEDSPRVFSAEITERKYLVEPHIPVFADFGRWRGCRVLEIGCGIGTDTLGFASAGAHVTAVDLSPRSVKIARERIAAYPCIARRVTFHVGNAEDLLVFVPESHYDLVYSFGVIHHTPHPERAMDNIGYYMGPHSILKIMLYHRHSWKAAWAILQALKSGAVGSPAKLVAHQSEAQSGCPVTYTYTPRMARKLLRGYEILDMHVDHIFPYRIPDYIEYRYVREWYWRMLPRAVFAWLEHRIGWHLLITARKVYYA